MVQGRGVAHEGDDVSASFTFNRSLAENVSARVEKVQVRNVVLAPFGIAKLPDPSLVVPFPQQRRDDDAHDAALLL